MKLLHDSLAQPGLGCGEHLPAGDSSFHSPAQAQSAWGERIQPFSCLSATFFQASS